MIVNGMGYRDIETVTGIHHNTVLRWHCQLSEILPDAYKGEQIPKVVELDELATFVGEKAARPRRRKTQENARKTK